MKTARPKLSSFHGLNNVADPLALDASWQLRADNCVVTDHGKLERARWSAGSQ